MSAFTRTGITQALTALTTLALAVSFWLWVDTPEFVYNFVGNARACSVQQIVNFPPETDFVALGSSRVRRGISPATLIEESGGLIQYPMNLGRGGFVPFRTLSMLRDVLTRENNIKFAYVEVNLRALLGGYSRSRLFLDKAQFALVTRPNYGAISSALSELPAAERIRALLMLEFLKVKHGLVMLFTGTVRKSYAQLAQPAPSVCWLQSFDRQRQLDVEKINKAERRKLLKYGPLDVATRELEITDTWAAVVELKLIDEIRDLAKTNDIELVLARPSGVHQPPMSEETVARIKLLVPEFEQPPAKLIRELWSNYFDANHMNAPARNAYTAWLAAIFLSRAS